MKRYEPSTPRAALGLSAVAMTAITVGAMVVLPAKIESGSVHPYTLAVTDRAARASIEAAIVPAGVDILELLEHEDQVHPVAQLSDNEICARNDANRAHAIEPGT
jgi:hypothetical protein